MEDKKSRHLGHRQRMKEKYLEHGIEVFSRHELLEVLLFYAVPRKNTNLIAHNLIDEFGSISDVMAAPCNALVNSGLNKNAALFLNIVKDILDIYIEDKFRERIFVVSDDPISRQLTDLFSDKTEEFVYLLLKDSDSNELYSEIICGGLNSAAESNIKKICELAVRYSAKNAVIAYNSPKGEDIPKKADIMTTIELYQALLRLNVVLKDNYFVSGERCISFSKSQIFFKSHEEFMSSFFYDNPLLE